MYLSDDRTFPDPVNRVDLFQANQSLLKTPQTKGIGIREIKSCTYRIHRITLAPPLARRLVPLSWVAATVLEKFHLFNSHYLVAIQP